LSKRRYIPERGDVVWLDFTPQTGREQAGRRPAVVLSPASYNWKAGLAIFCPVTSSLKGYPFETAVPADLPIHGVVLADQTRSLDWRSRKAELICRLPSEVMEDVTAKLIALLLPER
jgi:mRNA interferase MazF